MIRTTLYLSDKIHQIMKQLSVNSSTPMSQIVTDAVKTVFEEDIQDIKEAEKILSEYRKNQKSAVDFEAYVRKEKHKRAR